MEGDSDSWVPKSKSRPKADIVVRFSCETRGFLAGKVKRGTPSVIADCPEMPDISPYCIDLLSTLPGTFSALGSGAMSDFTRVPVPQLLAGFTPPRALAQDQR